MAHAMLRFGAAAAARDRPGARRGRGMAVMLVIIALGVTVDRVVFAPAERRVRERWGLADVCRRPAQRPGR
jgi:hypothetical protein